ncbi:MAG: S9 family peptidase [Rickettsiaceae bacterium]|nr:S9 family peptidase [Rickettsiaceae bacterium]
MDKILTAEKIPYKINIGATELIDNYHWLRDKNWPNVQDPKVLNYLKLQNEYSQKFFGKNQNMIDDLFLELKGRIKLEDISTYTKKEDYYYYTRTETDKDYSIYCRKKGSLNGPEEIILDLNELAVGRSFTKLSAFAISPSQKLLAYSMDFTGSERYTIYIKDLETGAILDEVISDTIGQVHWHEDGRGFFYTPLNDEWRHNTVKYHILSSNPSLDKIIMHETNNLFQLSISKSSSKAYFIIESSGHDSSEIYYFSMSDTEFLPKKLLSRKDKINYDVDHAINKFFIRTNDAGNNFRIATIEDKNPDENAMVDYIAYKDDTYISGYDLTSNYLLITNKKNALPEAQVINFTTKESKIISFEDEAYSAQIYSSNYEEDDIRVSYSSLKRPNIVYTYDFAQNTLSILKEQEIPSGFDPNEYEVKRLWAENDGVSIPLTILYKKSLFKEDGSNPLYLYGYGSYGISVPVSFRSSAISIVNRGFVYAIAHIRGGDDLGYNWYESAKFLNKKNSFADFLSCAHFLIDKHYTSEGKIVISGGSAGGMLVGQAVNEAPQLFKAVVAHVPFVDVLNTMLDETLPLTPGEFKEWGNPKDPVYFDYIKSYSPYDNVKKQSYPSMLITAGISDPRVTYWEAAKWTAKLREFNTGSAPIYLKVNMSAGHQGASGRFDYLEEVAEELFFVFNAFGIM